MTGFNYVLTEQDGLGATITAFNPDAESPLVSANSAHPHFEDIVAGVKAGDPAVWGLFNVADGVMSKLRKVSDRVSWNGSEVLFDGDPIDSTLADQLSRAIREGKTANYVALAAFWEKLESNPEPHSKEQAYKFLASHQFQITADGDVVGFKGVRKLPDGRYTSIALSQVRGKPSAWVDGKAEPEMSVVTQHIGATVSMPRSEVVHDPHKHCARGLHVSTQSYARSYGDTVVEVQFNPAKLVSVPNDSGEKVRVHEYTIRREALTADNYGQSTVLVESADTVGWVGDVGAKV